MNQDQVMSLVRSVGLLIGGFLVGKTWITSDQLNMFINEIIDAIPKISAAVAAIAPIVITLAGIFKHSDNNKVKAVEAMPDVDKILVKPDTTSVVLAQAAADHDRPKVALVK